MEEFLIRETFENRIGRKLTDEEVNAFILSDKIRYEAERDFSVNVHFHKGSVTIECDGSQVFIIPDFDQGAENWVNDVYHLSSIVYQALRLERIGLAEIRDFVNNQKKGIA